MRCGLLLFICASVCLLSTTDSGAESFPLPSEGDNVVGELRYVEVRSGESLVDIARDFNLGYDQIVRTNPTLNRWVPDPGTKVLLPHRYILVGNSRRGIVLNIAELRLYFYTPTLKGDVPRVITHPVSIGRMDWRTPLGTTSVTKKERDPPWRPPPSIRREHALDGDPLPEVIPGGSPDNPLGRFALRLGFPSYLIHGVDERKAYGIGMRVTHGCVRMYPEDIESLFAVVPVGTPVMIVNEPIKLGRQGDSVLLEVHQPLEEGEDETAPEAPHLSVEEVIAFVRRRLPSGVTFDEDLVAKIAEEGNGIPTEIARAPLTLAGVPMARPEVLPTGQSQLQKPRQKPQSALDEEYERAVSRYLTESDTPTSVEREATKIEPRRTTSRPRKATLPDVQRYVEDHY
jgi:L,D-transpeptidase ErfK/SrfK